MTKKFLIPAAIFIIAAGVFIYAVVSLTSHQKEFDEADDVYAEMIGQYTETETSSSSKNDETATGQNGTSAVSNTDISDNAAPVDIDAFIKNNPNCIGWIYCEDTPINYPIMQAEDNEYYLRRLPNGGRNICGSVFLDCVSSPDFSDEYSILYGHHFKKNDSMFGSIVNFADSAYFESHRHIYIYQTNGTLVLTPVFCFTAEEDDRVYSIASFCEDPSAMLAYMKEKGDMRGGVSYTENDRFVALSTCSYEYENARFILICKCERQ